MFRCNAYPLPVVEIVYKLCRSTVDIYDTLLSPIVMIVYVPVL